MSAMLLYPSSPQLQVADVKDGESSDSESIVLDEVAKKIVEMKKCQESSKLVS